MPESAAATHVSLFWNDLPFLRLLCTSFALFLREPHDVILLDGPAEKTWDFAAWLKDVEPRWRKINPQLRDLRRVESGPLNHFYKHANIALREAKAPIFCLYGSDMVLGHPGYDSELLGRCRSRTVTTGATLTNSAYGAGEHRGWHPCGLSPFLRDFDPEGMLRVIAEKQSHIAAGAEHENDTNYIPWACQTTEFLGVGGFIEEHETAVWHDVRAPYDLWTLDRLTAMSWGRTVSARAMVWHFYGGHQKMREGMIQRAERLRGETPPGAIVLPDIISVDGLDQSLIRAAQRVYPGDGLVQAIEA